MTPGRGARAPRFRGGETACVNVEVTAANGRPFRGKIGRLGKLARAPRHRWPRGENHGRDAMCARAASFQLYGRRETTSVTCALGWIEKINF